MSSAVARPSWAARASQACSAADSSAALTRRVGVGRLHGPGLRRLVRQPRRLGGLGGPVGVLAGQLLGRRPGLCGLGRRGLGAGAGGVRLLGQPRVLGGGRVGAGARLVGGPGQLLGLRAGLVGRPRPARRARRPTSRGQPRGLRAARPRRRGPGRPRGRRARRRRPGPPRRVCSRAASSASIRPACAASAVSRASVVACSASVTASRARASARAMVARARCSASVTTARAVSSGRRDQVAGALLGREPRLVGHLGVLGVPGRGGVGDLPGLGVLRGRALGLLPQLGLLRGRRPRRARGPGPRPGSPRGPGPGPSPAPRPARPAGPRPRGGRGAPARRWRRAGGPAPRPRPGRGAAASAASCWVRACSSAAVRALVCLDRLLGVLAGDLLGGLPGAGLRQRAPARPRGARRRRPRRPWPARSRTARRAGARGCWPAPPPRRYAGPRSARRSPARPPSAPRVPPGPPRRAGWRARRPAAGPAAACWAASSATSRSVVCWAAASSATRRSWADRSAARACSSSRACADSTSLDTSGTSWSASWSGVGRPGSGGSSGGAGGAVGWGSAARVIGASLVAPGRAVTDEPIVLIDPDAAEVSRRAPARRPGGSPRRRRRPRDPDTGQQVGLGDLAPGRALRADRDLAARDHGREQVGERGGQRRARTPRPAPVRRTRPPRRSATATPRRRRPAAVAATVNPWLQRSGSSAPQVTLTTSGRGHPSHRARPPPPDYPVPPSGSRRPVRHSRAGRTARSACAEVDAWKERLAGERRADRRHDRGGGGAVRRHAVRRPRRARTRGARVAAAGLCFFQASDASPGGRRGDRASSRPGRPSRVAAGWVGVALLVGGGGRPADQVRARSPRRGPASASG